VLEFCDAGDLYRALRFPTPPGLVLRVTQAVCSGMAYLHRRQIMHRDLKSSNVLLTTAGRVKLTDFGVAVQVAGSGAPAGSSATGTSSPQFEVSCDPLTTETGTYRWMAPEVTRHEGYTKSADVFSYGMLLFELISHEVPFADRPPLQAAVAIGLQDLRPPLPEGTPPSFEAIIQHCWNRRPWTRPKFDELIATLQQVQANLTPEELQWLDAPSGHPVYGNSAAGAETGGVANPPPAGGQRPTSRGVMSAIIEPHPPAAAQEAKLTLSVSGT
jgi:serine/threonine protein kinase